ncbi:MAG: PorV/PorQ family protein [Rubricoccaceae bacterium]|nr:PorV/PorQ family protein [Rubricoccaceae bacterium]
MLSFRIVSTRTFLAVLAFVFAGGTATSQDVVKYGADFLAGGVGARALGMGGAYVGHANDVTSGYWNVAGLSALDYPEVAYMHAERFNGIVSFDYGAAAFPLTSRSTVGISFFRSGVDDIANTLAAFNPDTGLPRPNPENFITYFSAADYAFFLSYARRLRDELDVGVTGKIIRRSIGDFASAWGYSFDLGAQYRLGRFLLGLNIQDASSMIQSWSVNQGAFEDFEATFGETAPQGGTEMVLPVARLGGATNLALTEDIGFMVGLDLDLAFDGQDAYAFNTGDISFHPRIGGEMTYKGLVALRGGISNVTTSDRYGTQFTPTVGAGLNISQVSVDYGFGDFGGLQSDLGYSHRISVKLSLEQPRFQRDQGQTSE